MRSILKPQDSNAVIDQWIKDGGKVTHISERRGAVGSPYEEVIKLLKTGMVVKFSDVSHFATRKELSVLIARIRNHRKFYGISTIQNRRVIGYQIIKKASS